MNVGGPNIEIDPAVRKALPAGANVTSTEGFSASFWAKTGRINVQLNNGTQKSYFIKVVSGSLGKSMAIGEFESMSAIHKVVPEFAPRPVACGQYADLHETYFFLCEYRDMSNEMPSPSRFTHLLSNLHHQSESPSGRFGFHVPTYAGNLVQFVGWEDSWEVFFTKSMRNALDVEMERKGPSVELDSLSKDLFGQVIPRLLRPLESNGRSVRPSLVHGDLWYANSGVDVNTGQILIFDACCFYAHHEYEFGQWRPRCNKFGDEYITAYTSHHPISEPKEDFLGRLDLYRLRFDTHVSALFVQKDDLRQQVIDVMRDLVQRYGVVSRESEDEEAKFA